MIKITMTDGVSYLVTPGGVVAPPAGDDKAAWARVGDFSAALRTAMARLDGDYHPERVAAMVGVLARLPGVASAVDLDPQPPDDAPERDGHGARIVY